MTGWPLIISVFGGLLTGVAGAYVALRKLPGDTGLTSAQRDQTMVGIAQGVASMVREELLGCRTECEQLRDEVRRLTRRCRAFEQALADAHMPIPTEGSDDPL